ncbi:ABC transporter permease [Paenibacillus pasadenensis]|uniref:ABC transporter permease n=1 Tax=Paenibacillus pasadenensis TaxID=217090 RepID=UPI00203DCF88|nr:ABC transporter permease [Paenibacillus pasadenensis]MCM3747747.1 ABC transporter permease [Paenibacillus pasadenensis]
MRIRSIALRIARQFRNDRRTLALLFVAPLFILSLFFFIFKDQPAKPVIGLTVGETASSAQQLQQAEQRLQQAGARTLSYKDEDAGRTALADGSLDALVIVKPPGGPSEIVLEGTDPSRSRAAMSLLQGVLSGSTATPTDSSNGNTHAETDHSNGNAPSPHISYLHGDGSMTLFDSIGPVLIGLFSFFFVFLLAGVSFLRERTTGTLERLLATPVRRTEVVLGYLAGFGLFAAVQAALIAAFATSVLGLRLEGSIWLLLLVNIMLSFTALTLGTLLSTYAGSEFQIIQFIPVVIVPQVFFSGLFRLDGMPDWLQLLQSVMPIYYGADVLRGVMLRGEGWTESLPGLSVLFGFSAVFALLNVLALKKQRSI